MSGTRHAQSTQNKLAYLCRRRYIQKSMGDEVDFLAADKQKSFIQVDKSLWVCLAMHVQSTQNNKFTISLQYLKEYVKNEVDVLPADKGASTKNLCQASGLADYGF